MIFVAQALLGLTGVQVFFLLSRSFGAPWGVFAPGAAGRAGSAIAAVGLAFAGLVLARPIFVDAAQSAWIGWSATAIMFLWFLIVAMARDEGESLLWRPVAGLVVACALILVTR